MNKGAQQTISGNGARLPNKLGAIIILASSASAALFDHHGCVLLRFAVPGISYIRVGWGFLLDRGK